MTIAPQPNKKLKAAGSKEGERDRKRPRHNPSAPHEQSLRTKNARTQGSQSKVNHLRRTIFTHFFAEKSKNSERKYSKYSTKRLETWSV
jgi:hypothetical protein